MPVSISPEPARRPRPSLGARVLWLAGLVLAAATVTAATPTIFRETFERAAAPGWTGSQPLVVKNGELFIELAPGAAPSERKAVHAIPLEGLRGGTVQVSATVRAENVSARAKAWNGIKLMLETRTAGGTTLYPQAKVAEGTFPSSLISLVVDIPRDATALNLIVGLERVTGKVWFSNINVRLLVPPLSDAPISPAKVGDEVFVLDFADEAMRAMLESQGGVITSDGPGGTPAVRFDVNPATNPQLTNTAAFKLDVRPLLGSKVTLSARIRGEGIRGANPDKPLAEYLGGKSQLALDSPTAGKRWIDTNALHGTFDWRESVCLGGINADESSATIRLGLEQATGSIWLTDVRMRVVEATTQRPAPPAAVRAAVAAARTSLRGFMSPQKFAAKDFADLAALNVNVVRWQMYYGSTYPADYDQWLAGKLDELALALDASAASGLRLAVDLHGPPGGRVLDRTYRMYLEKASADRFVSAWEAIARRFQGHPGLWAYDLVNEPVQNTLSPPGLDGWLELQARAARAVRAIDPTTPIMIETDQWCSPEAFAWLQPLKVPCLVYQVHMYWPGEYTHQGVRTDQGVADGKNQDALTIAYPGTMHGKPFDKEALRRHLQPVRDFQLATGAPIYVGEFSVVRWAPGGAQYLDDLISIFEEYGWDWTYHAFREWPGWSVEHADLPRDRHTNPLATQPTERMQVLQKWFSKNKAATP